MLAVKDASMLFIFLGVIETSLHCKLYIVNC